MKKETGATIDLERAVEKKQTGYSYPIDYDESTSDSVYNALLCVGTLDELPIFTLARSGTLPSTSVVPS